MPNLLQMLRARLLQRQAQNLSECLHLWYQTSVEVSEICGQALYEQDAIQGDIGVLLDRADRILFQYRNDAGDARRVVSRYDQALARKVTDITKQVYELRNQTASFLIRSQGAGPFGGARTGQLQMDEYFQRALGESGVKLRSSKTDLDAELSNIWVDLEHLIESNTNQI